jgi:hypothetical protein
MKHIKSPGFAMLVKQCMGVLDLTPHEIVDGSCYANRAKAYRVLESMLGGMLPNAQQLGNLLPAFGGHASLLRTMWAQEHEQCLASKQQRQLAERQAAKIISLEWCLFFQRYRNVLISNPWLVVDHPKLCCISVMGSRAAFTTLGLGHLALLWQANELVYPCTCGASAYVHYIGGSLMSGSSLYRGICDACGVVQPRQVPPWIHTYQKVDALLAAWSLLSIAPSSAESQKPLEAIASVSSRLRSYLDEGSR